MPAEKHLTRPTAMYVHDRGLPPIATDTVRRLKELSVRLDAIACAKRNKFRRHELRSWKICRQSLRSDTPRCPTRNRDYRWRRRPLRSGRKIRDVLAVRRHRWTPFDAGAGSEWRWCRGIAWNFEQVPPIHIAAIWPHICIENDGAAIGRQRHLFHHKCTRRQ